VKHSWMDLASAAVGRAVTDDEAAVLLWAGSAFPFASPRIVYEQIRHSARHRVCVDDPGATCLRNRRIRKAESEP
jgi:hypothetical protein